MSINYAASLKLLRRGFYKKTTSNNRHNYWVSDLKPGEIEDGDPIFFVHGVGIGINLSKIDAEIVH